MTTFFTQLKWQFILLQKNNIISISFVVTLIYGIILFFLRDVGNLDKFLVTLVLLDPSIIGYFFIALAIYIEIKHGILEAIFVSSLSIHLLLITRLLSLSILGTLCSLLIAISVKGLDFDIPEYCIGSFGVSMLSALLGLIMLPFAKEFLKFALISIPVFLLFINIPLAAYLNIFDLGPLRYVFPVQGSIDLIDYAVSGSVIHVGYAYGSIVFFTPVLYFVAYWLFQSKIVQQ
jgi:fluoroquinolone transport system permease protein